MIKIEKVDNIFDIISKIKKDNSKNKKIVLEFPFGHNILYNKIALQSIKDSCGERKLTIVTSDILSKKIGAQLGIKYSIIKDTKFVSEKDILKYNYTFFEYLLYEIKNISSKFLSIFIKSKKNIDPRKKILKYYKQKTHLSIFILILFFSILIFLYVFFFALNKTYVYINPDIKVKTKAKNFIFMENSFSEFGNNNNIKLKKYSKKISLEKIIETTGVEQNNKYRAKGTVEIINNLATDIKLIGGTRLESKSGIIYRTNNWLTIPAAIKNKAGTLIPGIKQVDITADLKDKYGNIVGKKANINIENVILTIPGLEEKDRKNIFAKTDTKILGGIDKFKQTLGKNDLENAKKVFIESLKKEAVKQIQKEIEKQNKENNTNYKILEVNNLYKFSDIDVNLPDIKVGDKIKSFKITGDINVTTYAYNINSVISKLKNTVEKSLLVDKEKLLYINNKSIDIDPKVGIIYRQDNPLKIKATVEIEYNIEYNFKGEKDNYIYRLKQLISGMEKEEAEKRLINESLISNATIRIRPFFINTVSKYLDNIEFIVEK